MTGKISLDNLINELISMIGKKDNNVVFVKHYNSLLVDKITVEECIGNSEVKLLFFDYQSDSMQEAYEPFFGWMREIYMEDYSQSIKLDVLLENIDIYPPLREVFISIIQHGVAERKEDPILSEVGYETEKMEESIVKFFKSISDRRKTLMLFSNVNLANHAAMKIIIRLMKELDNSNIAIMGIYNESYVTPGYVQGEFSCMLKLIDSKTYLFDWDLFGVKCVIDNIFGEKQHHFLPKSREMHEYLVKINNMYYTYSFEQAIFYLEMLEQRIEREKINVSVHDKYKIDALHAIISLSKGDVNTTLLILGNNMHLEGMELQYQYWFNYIYALSQISLLQLQMALGGVEACKKIAELLKDEFLVFKSRYLECITKNYNWSAMFMVDFSIEVDELLIKQLIEYNYRNALAYIYVYLFENDNDFVDKVAKGQERLFYFWKGIEIGMELENTTFLQSAYMKNIILYAAAGYQELANRFYEKRLEIVKLENNRLMIAHSYNGMGFNNIIAEHYMQADEFFNKALNIYWELNETEFASETMYNLATNCFLAGDFEQAHNCVNSVLYMLDRLEILTIQMCNASKLYGIAGVSCFYIGETYKCIGYLAKMEDFMNHLFDGENVDYTHWDEDLCLYYMLKGMIYEETNIEKSVELFKIAEEHQTKIKGNKFITYAFLAIELAKCYRITGNEFEANKVLENAINYSNTMGYSRKMTLLISALNGMQGIQREYKFKLSNITFEDIRKMAKVGGNKKKLYARQRDLSILSKWQETLKNQPPDEQRLVITSISSIITTFNLDGGVYIKLENNKYIKKFCDTKYSYTDEVINLIATFFEKSPKCFIVNRIERCFMDYSELLSVYGQHNIASLIGIALVDNENVHSIFLGFINVRRNFTANNWRMTEDNLIMIRSAFEQMIATCNKINCESEVKRVNMKLTEISYTDTLTGLYNRQGFSYKIETIKENDIYKDNCLLYIDLDEFKEYNDVYGHTIGDRVLEVFANILKRNVGEKGYAVRYGGDEFVVVLHNVNEEDVNTIIEGIKLGAHNMVTEILKNSYNGNCTIPECKSIKYSIGITLFDDYSHDGMNEALRRADKALYYVKNNAKGKCMSYNSVERVC